MLFGLDGVEIGLIIVFLTLFAAILSGFPVAFAIGLAATVLGLITTVVGFMFAHFTGLDDLDNVL